MMTTQKLQIENKLKEKLRFGIEIEAITSKSLERADYHANYGDNNSDEEDSDDECQSKVTYGRYFYAEDDGSLDAHKSLGKYNALARRPENFGITGLSEIELITEDTFKYDKLDIVLDDLNASLIRHNAKLWFNNSCGAHVHVSMKGLNLCHSIGIDQVFAFRRKLFEGMRLFFNDDTKFKLWRNYYFRSYAKKIKRTTPLNRERYNEINFTLGDRIEIRSTHLMGVNSFEDMKKVYKIIFDSIIYCLTYKPIVKQFEVCVGVKDEIENINNLRFSIDANSYNNTLIDSWAVSNF